MEKFNDPIDELINKHRNAAGISTPESSNKEEVPPVPDKVLLPTDDLPEVTEKEDDYINYGDDDNDAEIAAEEAADEAERNKAIEEAAAERAKQLNTMMPPEAHNPVETAKDVNYQTDKVAMVTTMVNKVVAKYHLMEGGIPDEPDFEHGIMGRRAVMGDLIECYDNGADTVTPEFEAIILNNWVMPDGSTAAAWIKNPHTIEQEHPAAQKNDDNIQSTVDADTVPQININVSKGQDVTVNVDEDVVREMSTSKKIDIIVKEVSEEELKSTNIIENSQQDDIIRVFDTGINDTPITLPASGYRCVMRPINWFDFIRLVAPSSQNRADDELKKWSVIYKHMKNPSIGNFKDFDDFLRKTKYQDRELMMWAILVATADEEETLSLTCQNPKCRKRIDLKYRPRTIIHLDPDHIPKHYNDVHDVAPGEEAIKLFEKVSAKRTRYKLPHTGIIVEINEPSAHEFITKKLKLVQDLYDRYVPGGDLTNLDPEDPAMAEFDYLSANALYISSMSIMRDGKEYRFTNWDDIERIIKESLDADDSGILLKIIQKSRTNVSPVSFYLEDVECSKCHRVEKKIPINDIGSTLLFQVSRRLDNTEINLIEMD